MANSNIVSQLGHTHQYVRYDVIPTQPYPLFLNAL